MTLYDKIISLYPSLTSVDFLPDSGTILLQNDGQGDYIKYWKNINVPFKLGGGVTVTSDFQISVEEKNMLFDLAKKYYQKNSG